MVREVGDEARWQCHASGLYKGLNLTLERPGHPAGGHLALELGPALRKTPGPQLSCPEWIMGEKEKPIGL